MAHNQSKHWQYHKLLYNQQALAEDRHLENHQDQGQAFKSQGSLSPSLLRPRGVQRPVPLPDQAPHVPGFPPQLPFGPFPSPLPPPPLHSFASGPHQERMSALLLHAPATGGAETCQFSSRCLELKFLKFNFSVSLQCLFHQTFITNPSHRN